MVELTLFSALKTWLGRRSAVGKFRYLFICPGGQKIAWSKYSGDKLSWVQPGSHLSQLILITKIKKSSPGSSAGDSQAFWDFVPILSWM